MLLRGEGHNSRSYMSSTGF